MLLIFIYLVSLLVVMEVSNDIGQICKLEGAQLVLLENVNVVAIIGRIHLGEASLKKIEFFLDNVQKGGG